MFSRSSRNDGKTTLHSKSGPRSLEHADVFKRVSVDNVGFTRLVLTDALKDLLHRS